MNKILLTLMATLLAMTVFAAPTAVFPGTVSATNVSSTSFIFAYPGGNGGLYSGAGTHNPIMLGDGTYYPNQNKTNQYIISPSGSFWWACNTNTPSAIADTSGNMHAANTSLTIDTNGLYNQVTNYVAANFAPPPATYFKYVPSNNWLFVVSATVTNPVVKIGP